MASLARIHGIIHGASTAAAGVGAGLAQLPCSDAIPLVAIQKGMILAIAREHCREISEAAALALVGTLAATIGGRGASQILVGWIPGWGNVVNAATAASITEGLGWLAHEYFRELPHSVQGTLELSERGQR